MAVGCGAGLGWLGGQGGTLARPQGLDMTQKQDVLKTFCFFCFFGGTAVFCACMLIFQLRRLPLDWYENLAFSCFIPIGPHNSGWLYLENEINVCFINCAHTYLSKQTTARCVCVCAQQTYWSFLCLSYAETYSRTLWSREQRFGCDVRVKTQTWWIKYLSSKFGLHIALPVLNLLLEDVLSCLLSSWIFFFFLFQSLLL